MIPITIDSFTPSDAEPWETHFDYGIGGFPHVVPGFGPKHVLDRGCWCHPEVNSDRYTEGVMLHNVAQ